MTNNPQNAHLPWINDEVKALSEAAQKGKTPAEIAKKLGRSAAAIQHQANAQGVYFRDTEK
jgi:ParB-like chromosome segregation protein Spo0J